MKTTSTAIALVLAATGAAQAQDVTYLSYGIGYEQSENGSGGSDISQVTVDAAVEYSINQFYLMASVEHDRFEFDGGPSFDTTNYNARVGYEVSPGALIYIGAGSLDTFFLSRTSTEIGAQYDSGTFAVGLAYRNVDGTPFESYELAASYTVSPAVSVGMSYIDHANSNSSIIGLFGAYENGPLTVDGSLQLGTSFGNDTNILNVNADYEFGGQFRGLGGLSFFDAGGSDVVGITIGGGYEVAENMWIDATYSNLDGDSTDIQTIGLALTFETGSQALVTDRASVFRDRAIAAAGPQGDIVGNLDNYGFLLNF